MKKKKINKSCIYQNDKSNAVLLIRDNFLKSIKCCNESINTTFEVELVKPGHYEKYATFLTLHHAGITTLNQSH